jgi:methionine-rich copper-binding protein CopC
MVALRSRTSLRVAAALLAALAPAVAAAHALLLESTPADGAVLAAAPPRAVLRFDSRIERRLARAVLTGPDGRAVALAVDPAGADAHPDELALVLPALGPGEYRLAYHVLAVDGHATPGQIRFTVRPASPG